MDCERFFRIVDAQFGAHYVEPIRTESGGQCVVDFFHPRVVDRFGTAGVGTQFNRSGVVWVSEAGRLAIQLRVPEESDDAVRAALADAPLAVERTDHRGVATPDGEIVTVVHYSVGVDGVTVEELETTLSTVAGALAV